MMSASPNAMPRGYEETGTVDVDGVGEAVEWLAAKSPVWDGVDQTRPLTIEIIPSTEEASAA
jgi:hypothetical protein